MSYQISGEPERKPCSEMEGAFQRALCEEMEAAKAEIIESIYRPHPFIAWLSDPAYRAQLEADAAKRRQARIEKWGERRVNAKGIGLRVHRTWDGPRLTILPFEGNYDY